ncbi:MAG: GNAT family N-acetyltransferase [Candidatus Hodarchaeota archaeon]
MENIVSLRELFPCFTHEFLEPFKNVINAEIKQGMHLDFEISERDHQHKISPILRLARPEDAKEITEIYKELYDGTYPYKEMEDVREVRKLIEDPNVQWIIYQDPSYNIAGCVTFVLDFKNKRGYIRGFMLKKKYQGYIDITKAMIGSMLGMIHNFKDRIYNWYVENRTAHAKSQYSMWVCGIAPIAFYPNKDVFLGKIESDLMQILYDERSLTILRTKECPNIISDVEPCFQYSNKRYNLGSYAIQTPEIELDSSKLKALRKNIHKCIVKDKFGYETITFTIKNSDSYFQFLYTPQVQNFEKTKYKVKTLEQLQVFMEEFIRCREELGVRYCEVFVSAYKPEHQKIFHNAGLTAKGYIPSWKYSTKNELFKDHILFSIFDGKISSTIQLIKEGQELLKVLACSYEYTEAIDI